MEFCEENENGLYAYSNLISMTFGITYSIVVQKRDVNLKLVRLG